MRQRRFATTRRPPENERRQGLTGANLLEQAARTQYAYLADVLSKRARSHALSERGFLGRSLCGTMGEQIVRMRRHQSVIIPKTRGKGRALCSRSRHGHDRFSSQAEQA